MESECPEGISWNLGLSAENPFHRLSHASDILLIVVIS